MNRTIKFSIAIFLVFHLGVLQTVTAKTPEKTTEQDSTKAESLFRTDPFLQNPISQVYTSSQRRFCS